MLLASVELIPKSIPIAKVKLADIPVLSFFCGAGFLDIGFMEAGFNIVWRNENDPWFTKGFEYGMAGLISSSKDIKVQNTRSIVDINSKQIAREAFHNTQKPELFGVIGGPPCPDFSSGGKNRGREGDQGRLSQVFVDRILQLQPTFFLFENVPGLLRTAKHRVFFDSLLRQLSVHYYLDCQLLRALDYGIPQDRGRVFLVGVRKQWIRKNLGHTANTKEQHWFPWPDKLYENAKELFHWPTTSPFGGNPERPAGIPRELMVGNYICDTEEIAVLPNGVEGFIPYSKKFNIIAEGDVSGKSFKRLHRWRYSPTVAYGNNEVHLHPVLPRRLTVREAMRLQTVPDEYSLPQEMPLTHKFKTIGNGVPVKLARAIADSIATFIITNI